MPAAPPAARRPPRPRTIGRCSHRVRTGPPGFPGDSDPARRRLESAVSRLDRTESGEGPTQEEEILDVHPLRGERAVDRDCLLVLVLAGRRSRGQAHGLRIVGRLFQTPECQESGPGPLPAGIGRASLRGGLGEEPRLAPQGRRSADEHQGHQGDQMGPAAIPLHHVRHVPDAPGIASPPRDADEAVQSRTILSRATGFTRWFPASIHSPAAGSGGDGRRSPPGPRPAR